MKAKGMLEMAYICGLKTIEEAHLNVKRHGMNLFKYTDIHKEELELLEDMILLGMVNEIDGIPCTKKGALVSEYLSEEERETIDKDMEEYFQQND